MLIKIVSKVKKIYKFFYLVIFKKKLWNFFKQQIKKQIVKNLVLEQQGESSASNIDIYQSWMNVNRVTINQIQLLESRLYEKSKDTPNFSIIIPVYNPSLKLLLQTIESVNNQIYRHWQICLADDCSSNNRVRPFLENISKNDRIEVTFRETNGHISQATNSAVAIAKGDFLVFLDQDDLLAPTALAELALYVADHPEIQIIYSDDDKVSLDGRRFDPQFKPDWSPELLLSYMYMGHVLAVRRKLYTKLGGFHSHYDGSQDYEFMLRATEVTEQIGHISKILYHWRVMPGSTAAGGGEKAYSFTAGIEAVRDALQRRKIEAMVYQPEWALKNGNGIYALKFPDYGPSVAIIIPVYNQFKLLRKCIESLSLTSYKNYTIYVIDNDSSDPLTLSYLDSMAHRVLKISSPPSGFNFSFINNEAVKYTEEEFLLFLNNDTEVINPAWLSQMVGYAQIDGVGSVGARLIFPEGRIQHAGILHGINYGFPMPSMKLLDRRMGGYQNYSLVARNYSAVTAACMLTPKSLFCDLGGFDEKIFAVAFNDCDYCYRLWRKGFRNVFCPQAELYHHEGATRNTEDHPHEEAAYIRKYGRWKDPYYNSNLSLNCSDFTLSARNVVNHPSPRFKVLMVTHSLNLEGAPKSFFELVKGLSCNREFEIIIFSHADGPLRPYFIKLNIEVNIIENFNVLGLKGKKGISKELNRLTELVRNVSAHLIYGNTIQTFWAMYVACNLNIPAIWNIRESEEPFSAFNNNPIIKKIAQTIITWPYKVVFVADATKTVYEPFNTHHNFMVIHNGFDEAGMLARCEGISRDQAREKLQCGEQSLSLLLVGTVCDRKGQIDVIRAWSYLDERLSAKLTIQIIGDRKSLQYSKLLHKKVAELPLNKRRRIFIFDETDNVCEAYLAADIFICCSRVESFPKVIQEAMFFGLPIITTPVFGIVEQVRNNVSALFYEPGNYKQLADHIVKLSCDEKTRKRIGTTAKMSALKILPTLEEMCEDYATIFKEAWLSGGRR